MFVRLSFASLGPHCIHHDIKLYTHTNTHKRTTFFLVVAAAAAAAANAVVGVFLLAEKKVREESPYAQMIRLSLSPVSALNMNIVESFFRNVISLEKSMQRTRERDTLSLSSFKNSRTPFYARVQRSLQLRTHTTFFCLFSSSFRFRIFCGVYTSSTNENAKNHVRDE